MTRSRAVRGMPMFFILVMDKYPNDPKQWLFSASALSEAELRALPCYEDPPHALPKLMFVSVSETRINLPPSAGGDSEGGTIYAIRHR